MERIEFPFREFRITVQTAAPVEALAEGLAEATGASSVYSVRAYWDTGLPELGVADQRVWRVEAIADPMRLILAIDRISEWSSREGASTLIEISPTFTNRGD